MNFSSYANGLRTMLVIVSLCAGLPCAPPSAARTLAEVKALGAISMCANPDALPFASDRADSPGFQIELGREIAKALGVSLTTEWILPRRRASTVNCDMLFDSVNDPEVHEGPMLLSRPYHKSSIALGLSPGASPVRDYREIETGRKVGVLINSLASVVLGKRGVSTSPYVFESDLVADLVKGDLYGGAVSSNTISYYIFRHPNSGLRLVHAFESEPELTWEVSVGLRQSDAALLDAVNKALSTLLADGTVTRIYARYGIEHRVP
jgi:ABC-type amino acid transport substrate-binding protein